VAIENAAEIFILFHELFHDVLTVFEHHITPLDLSAPARKRPAHGRGAVQMMMDELNARWCENPFNACEHRKAVAAIIHGFLLKFW
jgi:hypothetical protein